mmetsp:Transcript_22561/g.55002  ORF Transcript_22561/g.55002 Transcript_22561/m.55002 type:complete len:181 (+) Transcript_22561:266-808(+)
MDILPSFGCSLLPFLPLFSVIHHFPGLSKLSSPSLSPPPLSQTPTTLPVLRPLPSSSSLAVPENVCVLSLFGGKRAIGRTKRHGGRNFNPGISQRKIKSEKFKKAFELRNRLRHDDTLSEREKLQMEVELYDVNKRKRMHRTRHQKDDKRNKQGNLRRKDRKLKEWKQKIASRARAKTGR